MILISKIRILCVYYSRYLLVICYFEQVNESLNASMNPFKHYYAFILTCLFSSTRNRNSFFKNNGKYFVDQNSRISSIVLIQSIKNDFITGCEWRKFYVKIFMKSSQSKSQWSRIALLSNVFIVWFRCAAACRTYALGSVIIQGNSLNVRVKTLRQSSSRNLNMLQIELMAENRTLSLGSLKNLIILPTSSVI